MKGFNYEGIYFEGIKLDSLLKVQKAHAVSSMYKVVISIAQFKFDIFSFRNESLEAFCHLGELNSKGNLVWRWRRGW